MNDSEEWDRYWDNTLHGRKIYNIIASFYRKVIIRANLERIVVRYFEQDDKLLHAGCGSGEVDTGITQKYKVIGYDFSKKALERYLDNNPSANVVWGDIRKLPFDSGSFDGIYNLGVMEHFSRQEIINILTEFSKALKPKGKIVLFWPPEYGLSVILFKMLKSTLEIIGFKKVKFHPDEISRIRSKNDLNIILRNTDLHLKDYYFGIRDLFTYAVLIIEKDH